MGRWFLRCPAYQSGPGKDGFRIDVSMASQSSSSGPFLAASNRVCYTIYNSRTAEQILMIFSFFGFVSASQNGLNIKKIGKVTKKFPEKPGSISLELIFT